MPAVSTQKPEYELYAHEWKLIDNLCYKRNVEQYLIELNPDDQSTENRTRNAHYQKRAIYYNIIGNTYRGLLGSAFNKRPEIDLPQPLHYLIDNVDGKGVSLIQQAQSLTGEVIRKGRAGMFVSFPKLGEGEQASRQQMLTGEMAARIEMIDAKDIINWKTRRVGNSEVLSLVVFQQYEDSSDSIFDTDYQMYYRVLFLDENGHYNDQKWRYVKDNEFTLESDSIPRTGQGTPWYVIPFTFVGSENNDDTVDFPPLTDLAEVNVGHYRNSADLEDSAFYAGQPQPWMSGVTDDYSRMFKESKLYIGSRYLLPVPKGEQFAFAAAPPNPVTRELMSDKLQLMLSLGARLIQPGAGNKTATQVKSENATSDSVLGMIVANVENAYQTALAWCAEYMTGSADGIVFNMSRDFGVDVTDPSEIMAMVAAWNQGAVPTPDLWAWFRAHGIIHEDRTDAELEQDLAGVLPLDGDSVADNLTQ